ncbi:MAG: hypothetical protein ABI573_06210 [Chloroflexota bacterium]
MNHRHATERPALVAVFVALAILAGACGPRSASPRATPRASQGSGPMVPATATPGPTATPTATPTAKPWPAPTSPGTAIVAGSVDRSSLNLEATYDADVNIAVATGVVTVAVTMSVRNTSGGPIDRIELNTIAARLGNMTLRGVSVDDQPAAVTVDDQTIFVPLGGVLPDGAPATVRIGYRATLTRDLAGSDWLFSRSGGMIAMYRWIPWVSKAVPFDRPNHGDPFVTPTSSEVHVRVTTDVPMVLASPGPRPTLDGLTATFVVSDVRDVAIVLAPDFIETIADAGGVAVRAYTRPGGLDRTRVMAQVKHAIKGIGNQVGVAYPWPSFTVAEIAGGYGMESPAMIWIPRPTTSANLPYLIHHETAHQWFYGLVGNDQQGEPFADEAAADYVARTVLGIKRASRCAVAPLDRDITRYSQACYYEVVYIQGGNVLDELRRNMGTAAFWSAVGGYLTDHRFGLAGTQTLLDALVKASPVDLGPILQARFPAIY